MFTHAHEMQKKNTRTKIAYCGCRYRYTSGSEEVFSFYCLFYLTLSGLSTS